MKRPYLKTSYESWFYLQKLTLETTGVLQEQINWGEELHYISMQIIQPLRGEKKEIKTPKSVSFKTFVIFN